MDERNNGATIPGVGQANQILVQVDRMLDQGIYDRRIYSSLVSRDTYEGYGNVPGRYTEDGEYAMIYRLLLGRDAEGVTSLVISDRLAEAMSLDEEGLHEAAARNTPELFPPKIEKLVDVMKDFEAADIPEIEESPQADVLESPEVQDVYLVSNETRVLGAGAMYYEDKKVLQDLSESLQSDLIVLPSSIHEMMVLPDDGQKKISELEETIESVNSSVIKPREILGWKALRYERNTNELSVARDQDSPEREQDRQQRKAARSTPMRRGGR